MRKIKINLLTVLILLTSITSVNAQMLLPNINSGNKNMPQTNTNIPDLDDINFYQLQSLAEAESEELICDSEGCDSTFVYPNQLSLTTGPVSSGEKVNFKTTDLNGIPVFSDEIFTQSKVTMLNLWSVTCSACIREMPELARMNQEYKTKGGQVVSLVYDAIEEDQIMEARDIAQDLQLPFLTILPNDDIYRLFPTQFFPVTYFIDGEGKVIGDPVIGASPAVCSSHMDKYLTVSSE